MLASTSAAQPEQTRRPRGLANALRSAGLVQTRTAVDTDARMRDASAGPSGKPRTAKLAATLSKSGGRKVGHRQRAGDQFKNVADASMKMHSSRLAAGLSNPLAIRGAATRPGPRIRRGGSAMSVSSSASSGVKPRPLEVWREFVNSRWNAEARFLNLENMIDDEVLKKYDMPPPGVPGSSHKEMPVIFKLASQLKPPVQTISLANNNITSGSMLASLTHYLPSLSNLSLQNNQLRTWRDLDYISGRKGKLEHLREIVLLDNPVRDFELKNGRVENYKSEMSRRFPSLEVLDQEAVTKIAFDVPETSTSRSNPRVRTSTVDTFPLSMAPSFITGVDGGIISGFLSRFFPLFDGDRAQLAQTAYAPAATFSYSIVTAIPPRARAQGWHTSREMPNQRKLEWTPWLANAGGSSRNLSRMGGAGLERVVRSLHVGPADIAKAMEALPRTTHDVGGSPERFCIDAWPVGQGEAMLLFVSVHGEFAEAPSQGIRSFDRSFVLAPAPAGSKAQLEGWAVVVLSDQLIVRNFSSHEAWAPGPMSVQTIPDEPQATARGHRGGQPHQQPQPFTAGLPQPLPQTPGQPKPAMVGPPVPAEQLPALAAQIEAQVRGEIAAVPDPQRSLVLAICQRTGLNVKFAIDCLEGNGWDLDKAVANYEQVKNTLTREAFL